MYANLAHRTNVMELLVGREEKKRVKKVVVWLRHESFDSNEVYAEKDGVKSQWRVPKRI